MAAGSDAQRQCLLDAGVLHFMSALLQHRSRKLNREAAWLIANVATGPEAQVQAVFDAQLVPHLFVLLRSGYQLSQLEAAWAVSNIAISGSLRQCALLIESGESFPLEEFYVLTIGTIIQYSMCSGDWTGPKPNEYLTNEIRSSIWG